MTRDMLAHRVAQGEGLTLEFKHRVPSPERMAKEVAAFANTCGGEVLIGVEDNGATTGVKDAAEEEYALRQAVDKLLDPPVEIATARIRISRKRSIILATVPESDRKPHFLVTSSGDRRTAYVRVDDKSVRASKEARRLMRTRPDWDVLIKINRKEHILLRHLAENERITVRQFAALAGISRSSASQTLVHLTRARMLRHHPALGEDYFTQGLELLSLR